MVIPPPYPPLPPSPRYPIAEPIGGHDAIREIFFGKFFGWKY